ncbi:MAG TPA: MFS transporter [Planctomycetota bacterium]|nr:MFS transporter [Planctomycetota bacterium]
MDNRRRLFLACCLALIANAMWFAVSVDILGDFVRHFRFTREQVGQAVSWGGMVGVAAMFIIGGLLDFIGVGVALWLAVAAHLVGVTLVIFAQGFWSLAIACTCLALATSTVEAATNPFIATVYPDRKTHMLNVFHAWWPGGIVIGGLLAWGFSAVLNATGASQRLLDISWQIKMAFVYVPVIAYALLILGQKFPKTERVQAGVPTSVMFKEALRPMFLILVFCMLLTASIELGPNRWLGMFIEDLMGIRGVLVLIYLSWLMFVLRFFAGPVARVLTPTGIMAISSVVAGVGLLLLSGVRGWGSLLVASTVFGLGCTYMWPTMLGIVSERFPKGGTLLLAILGGAAGLFLSLVTGPKMGAIHDHYAEAAVREALAPAVQAEVLERYAVVETVREEIGPTLEGTIAGLAASLDAARRPEPAPAPPPTDAATREQPLPKSLLTRIDEVKAQLSEADRRAVEAALTKAADPAKRKAIEPPRLTKAIPEAVDRLGTPHQRQTVAGALKEANRRAASITFRYVAALSVVIFLVFAGMFLYDRARGGYKQEFLDTRGAGGTPA